MAISRRPVRSTAGADGLCRNGPITPFRPSPESGPGWELMRGEGTVVVADLLELPPYHAGEL